MFLLFLFLCLLRFVVHNDRDLLIFWLCVCCVGGWDQSIFRRWNNQLFHVGGVFRGITFRCFFFFFFVFVLLFKMTGTCQSFGCVCVVFVGVDVN